MQQYKPGDRIGGEYLVQEVFGGTNRSGQGVVYLVRDREAPFPFVLKTLQHSEQPEAKRRFLSEAQAWINAGAHPNVVQAYWVREIAGELFVAAEYVALDEEGRNNLTHFLRGPDLRAEIVLRWCVHFCRGMEYARSKGILAHRDIKPDNLMIDRTGALKVTDFGLAKSHGLDLPAEAPKGWFFQKKVVAGAPSMTKTGSGMGTFPYMAPEQFVDFKRVDHRADIYSFGIVLFQMLSGNRYPYRINLSAADVATEFYQAHSEQPPAPLKSPLGAIVALCLQKDPERRYPTYAALLDHLSAVALGLEIKLPRPERVDKRDEELFAIAQSYGQLGDMGRAKRAIDQYVSEYPQNACGWTEKGKIHGQLGENLQALAATRRSLEIDPSNTHAWNNLGIFLNRTDAPIDEVKRAYAMALTFDPQNTAAMMNFVGPLVLNGEFTAAANLAARAVTLRPEKPAVLLKADALLTELMEGEYLPAARALLTAWTKARPDESSKWLTLGYVHARSGDADQAIDCYKRVRALDPEDSTAVAQLARLFFGKQKAKECLEACEILLRRGHERLLAVSLKCQILNILLGYEEARSFLQPYLDASPDNDALWVLLGKIHEYWDDYDSAIEALTTAKRLLEGGRGEHRLDNLRAVDEKLEELRAKT